MDITTKDTRNSTAPTPYAIWIMIALLWCFPFAFYAAHLSILTNYLFPMMALIVGAVLIYKTPNLFLAHIWWLWILTPELRRLVDYQIGWQPVSPIMLSPYLGTALAVLTVTSNIRLLNKNYLFPFALAAIAVLYGYVVGVITSLSSILPATFALLNWLLPILFGLHVAIRWRDYECNIATIVRTFIGATLVMGAYGIIQFMDPPPWDRFWMINSKMMSIGQPYPFEIRVFSTMNSPNPFAFEIMGALLLLFVARGFWRIPAAIVGYIAFLLSLVRSAWGAWAVGLLYILYRSRPKHFIRYILGVIIVAALALPLATYGPIEKHVNKRINSIENLEQNASYQARIDLYENFALKSFTSPVGAGLGSLGVAARLSSRGQVVDFDSGVMEIPYTLGWLGGLFFYSGAIWSLLYVAVNNRVKRDHFIAAAASIALAVFSGLIFSNTLIGATGMLFWGFCGVAMAGIKYHREADRLLRST